jgi:hypothetical protein
VALPDKPSACPATHDQLRARPQACSYRLMGRAESHAAGSRSMDSVWGLRSWARSAAGIEVMTTEQADAFEAQFDQAVTRTQFASP